MFTTNALNTSINSSTQTKPKPTSIYHQRFGDLLMERSTELKLQNPTPQSELRSFLLHLWSTQNSQSLNFTTKGSGSSSEAFVSSILESAKSAALELGTTPEVIIAFAALETGWGKHVIKNVDGSSSHNLFGIKAHSDLEVENSVYALTNEFIDNRKIRLQQAFRRYESKAESVADFANFLKSNPRYQQALSVAHDPSAFIEGIHDAGYATDPNYATKVKALVKSVNAIADSLNNGTAPTPLISLDNNG